MPPLREVGGHQPFCQDGATTLKRPRFKNHFLVAVVEPDLLILLSETAYSVLEGSLYTLLAPLINGQNTATDIADKLGSQVTILDVLYGLSSLEEKGYLVEAGCEPAKGIFAFRDTWGIAARRRGYEATTEAELFEWYLKRLPAPGKENIEGYIYCYPRAKERCTRGS